MRDTPCFFVIHLFLKMTEKNSIRPQCRFSAMKKHPNGKNYRCFKVISDKKTEIFQPKEKPRMHHQRDVR